MKNSLSLLTMIASLTLVNPLFAAEIITSNQSCGSGSSCEKAKSCDTSTTPSTNQPTLSTKLLASSNSIRWQVYTPKVFEQAKAKKRLILLFAEASGCEWSKLMESNTFHNPAVIAELNQHYLPIFLDFDKNKDIAIQYKIIELPTIMIFDETGKVIKELQEYTAPQEMASILQSIAAQNKVTS